MFLVGGGERGEKRFPASLRLFPPRERRPMLPVYGRTLWLQSRNNRLRNHNEAVEICTDVRIDGRGTSKSERDGVHKASNSGTGTSNSQSGAYLNRLVLLRRLTRSLLTCLPILRELREPQPVVAIGSGL